MSDQSGIDFMAATRSKQLGITDQQRGEPAPPVVEIDAEDDDTLELPNPENIGIEPVNMYGLITGRRSLRKYAETPLSKLELSFLLWATQGVKKQNKINTLRTVPSAGARHAFETLVLVNRVDGVESGLYGYAPLKHRIVKRDSPDRIGRAITQACYGQSFIDECAGLFIWVAIPYRMTWRYSSRGYRYLHLDAGHVCQNLYLAAEAISCGACGIGAFDDDSLNTLLRLDGESAFAIYLGTVGKRD